MPCEMLLTRVEKPDSRSIPKVPGRHGRWYSAALVTTDYPILGIGAVSLSLRISCFRSATSARNFAIAIPTALPIFVFLSH